MTVCESCLRFDLPENGSRHHETVNLTNKPKIDLEILLRNAWRWVEIKNWESPEIPSQHLQAQRLEFIAKMLDENYWVSLAANAQGAHDFLEERSERPVSPNFIFLYKSAEPMPESVGMAILQNKISALPDLQDVMTSVLDRQTFGYLYPELNVRECLLASDLSCPNSALPTCTRARKAKKAKP